MKKKEVLKKVVRHTLTFVGGILVMKGIVSEQEMYEIIGGLTTMVGITWSVKKK